MVAPATADLLAKMAGGHADDLATAVLLATDKPVLVAPAMNPRMWLNPATQRNVAQLKADGIAFVGPNVGEMAERGEAGPGRMAEPLEIAGARWRLLLAAGGTPSRPARPQGSREGQAADSGRLPRSGVARGNSRRSTCSSLPGRRMSRSTRCATSPTGLRANRAMPWPPRRPVVALA